MHTVVILSSYQRFPGWQYRGKKWIKLNNSSSRSSIDDDDDGGGGGGGGDDDDNNNNNNNSSVAFIKSVILHHNRSWSPKCNKNQHMIHGNLE